MGTGVVSGAFTGHDRVRGGHQQIPGSALDRSIALPDPGLNMLDGCFGCA
jgi:hypothetical protein